jgi:hypothetical protein
MVRKLEEPTKSAGEADCRLRWRTSISRQRWPTVSLSVDEIGADLWAKHGAMVGTLQGNIPGNTGLERVEREGQGIGHKSLR